MRLIVLLIVSALSHSALAGPATKPSDAEDFVISKMRVQEFKPRTYLSLRMQTTLEHIGPAVTQAVNQIKDLMRDAKVQPAGPGMLIYHGVTQNPTAPFELQVGYIVADETKDIGEARVQKLEPFRAAVVLYSGPIKQVGEAWRQAYESVFENGMTPSGEAREVYFHWEGPDSPNNVHQIQVGVK